MLNFLTPNFDEYLINIPDDPIAIIGWVVWLCLILWFVIRFRDRGLKLDRQMLIWMAVLSILVLLFTPFFGLSTPEVNERFADTRPIQHWMFLAAVPLLMAGGLLGILPSVMLSAMSGLLLAYLDTNNIFTPLVFMTLAASFSWAVRQRFRTKPYKLLRFPLFAVIFSLILILPFLFIAIILGTEGDFPFRLAAAFEQVALAFLPLSGMMMIGGVVCVVTRATFHKKWGSLEPLKYPPGKFNLKYRMILLTFLALLIIFIFTFSSLWFGNVEKARQSLITNLMETSTLAAEGLPVFVSSGRNFISDISARGTRNLDSSSNWKTLLDEKNQAFPFFEEMVLLNLEGKIVASYPESTAGSVVTELIFDTTEGAVDIFSTSPNGVSSESELNFISGVKNQAEGKPWILWGKTNLSTNPYFKLFMDEISAIEQQGGFIQILDEQHTHLYHSDPKHVPTESFDFISDTPTNIENKSSDGRVMMQYFQPINELKWAVIASLPAQAQYEVAWENTLPLSIFGLCAICVVLLVELFSLTPAANQIKKVKNGLEAVTAGKFNYKINRHPNLGEMTQLTNAYNQMVSSLLLKWQKQSDLISLNERLSDQKNMSAATAIIMKTALAHGVSSVRIILEGQSESKVLGSSNKRFGMGKLNEHFAGLDDQIISQVRSEGILVLRDFRGQNPSRWNDGFPAPASIIAVPINEQTDSMGVLWVTYKNLRFPDDEEVNFFTDLAQKTSNAIANLATLDNATGIRRQFENFLDAFPDAILITDGGGNLVYSNEKSKELFDLDGFESQRMTFSSLIIGADTITTYHPGKGNTLHKEIKTGDGKYLKVVENEIRDDDRMLGKAYLVSNISNQKAQELKRNDFVTTARHELRSPLTLIHGYAKILQLTGNLNNQQDDYINNIIEGIEEMKDLVRKLLDIGHLEGGDSLEITQFFASDLIQKVVDNVEAQAKQKNIQVSFQRPELPLSIEADRTYLTLALRNLLENAIKFTKMSGEVAVSVRKNDADVVFAVKDSGIGIAPLDKGHLFEKFYRGRTPVGQDQNSSGLGLAIVKSITERHGGKVSVDSQLGKGSTFFIQIPHRSKESSNTIDF